MLTRRLWLGGGSVTLPPGPPTSANGPYDPALTVGATVLTQLHCHTNQSDGAYSPAAVVADYLGAGYGALAITDHDHVTTQPAGVTTAIVANELSPTTQHIISLGSSYERGALTDAQAILDGIAAAGGLAEIAHPLWLRGMTYAEMAALTGYMGMEIHNTVVVTGSGQNPVTYPGFALDRWDALLTGSRRDIWGFAVDDLHSITPYRTFDVGRVQVFVATNNLANILARLSAGCFVADVSNYGVTPGYPVRTDDDVSVTCPGAVRVEAWGPTGLLAAADADSLTYTYEGSEYYVRLVAVGEYTEPFTAALSDRWQAVEGSWAVAGGTLGLAGGAVAERIILRRHREGDFATQIDVKMGSGGNDTAALMFNVLNESFWYILRIGESTVTGWNNRLAVGYTTNGTFTGPPIASYAFDPTPGTWYTMKMAYAAATGLIQAKIWERGGTEPADWQLSVSDTHWRTGGFGLRANRTPEFDNLYIKGFRTYYQPIAVDPA